MANLIHNLGVNRVKRLAQQNLVVKKKEDVRHTHLINHKKRQSFFSPRTIFLFIKQKVKVFPKDQKNSYG